MSGRENQKDDVTEIRRLNSTISVMSASLERTRQELASARQEMRRLAQQIKDATNQIQDMQKWLELYALGKVAVADAFEQ